MRFTEHELTAALTGAAKQVAVQGRRGDPDEAWERMNRYQRFKLLDALGTQVLPVLVALPDVEVAPGTRPSYTDAEVAAAVESRLGEDVGRFRRSLLVRSRVALVRSVLAQLPPRLDPDALLSPDQS